MCEVPVPFFNRLLGRNGFKRVDNQQRNATARFILNLAMFGEVGRTEHARSCSQRLRDRWAATVHSPHTWRHAALFDEIWPCAPA